MFNLPWKLMCKYLNSKRKTGLMGFGNVVLQASLYNERENETFFLQHFMVVNHKIKLTGWQHCKNPIQIQVMVFSPQLCLWVAIFLSFQLV